MLLENLLGVLSIAINAITVGLLIRTSRRVRRLEATNETRGPVMLSALERLDYTWGLTDDERALAERLRP